MVSTKQQESRRPLKQRHRFVLATVKQTGLEIDWYILMPCNASSSGTPELSLIAQMTLKQARLTVFLQAPDVPNNFRPAAVFHFTTDSVFAVVKPALSRLLIVLSMSSGLATQVGLADVSRCHLDLLTVPQGL